MFIVVALLPAVAINIWIRGRVMLSVRRVMLSTIWSYYRPITCLEVSYFAEYFYQLKSFQNLVGHCDCVTLISNVLISTKYCICKALNVSLTMISVEMKIQKKKFCCCCLYHVYFCLMLQGSQQIPGGSNGVCQSLRAGGCYWKGAGCGGKAAMYVGDV